MSIFVNTYTWSWRQQPHRQSRSCITYFILYVTHLPSHDTHNHFIFDSDVWTCHTWTWCRRQQPRRQSWSSVTSSQYMYHIILYTWHTIMAYLNMILSPSTSHTRTHKIITDTTSTHTYLYMYIDIYKHTYTYTFLSHMKRLYAQVTRELTRSYAKSHPHIYIYIYMYRYIYSHVTCAHNH